MKLMENVITQNFSDQTLSYDFFTVCDLCGSSYIHSHSQSDCINAILDLKSLSFTELDNLIIKCLTNTYQKTTPHTMSTRGVPCRLCNNMCYRKHEYGDGYICNSCRYTNSLARKRENLESAFMQKFRQNLLSDDDSYIIDRANSKILQLRDRIEQLEMLIKKHQIHEVSNTDTP